MRRGAQIVLAGLAAAGLAFAGSGIHAADAVAANRDDTAWLQAALDAGGQLFLKKLPDGQCYETHGLWVSMSGTTIDSDGACVEYLGPGPVRLASDDGDPIAANAIFFVNRSSTDTGPPERVSISHLRLWVPGGIDAFGLLVAGTDITLDNLVVEGAPLDAVTVTGRGNGRGYAGPVAIRGSRLLGARRNVISVIGAVGVTIDSNLITGAGNLVFLHGAPISHVGPWAGIEVEPDQAGSPVENLTISNNTISDNSGAGVLLALATDSGLAAAADQIRLFRNSITGNSAGNPQSLRGGVCLQGGQADGLGRLSVISNTIVGNGGWGLCSHPDGFNMTITHERNAIYGNSGGNSQWWAGDGSEESWPEGRQVFDWGPLSI